MGSSGGSCTVCILQRLMSHFQFVVIFKKRTPVGEFSACTQATGQGIPMTMVAESVCVSVCSVVVRVCWWLQCVVSLTRSMAF